MSYDDDDVMSTGEWDDVRQQCAIMSPGSIWRKLLTEHDRQAKLGSYSHNPGTPALGQPVSPERPEIEPYILMDDAGHWAYHLTHEELRIVMTAIAGFPLSEEERQAIKPLYMTIFDALCPGTLRRPILPRKEK